MLRVAKLRVTTVASRVADPGCFSRIPDPKFYPSQISDPGSKNSNKREGEIVFFGNLFCSHKFNKIVNFFSEMLKIKIWPIFKEF